MRSIRCLMGFLLCLPLYATPETGVYFESGPRRTTMIELFTSEGCSSCPPAEAYLNRFADHPDLWRRYIPLAFHVDYWDYLGWRDPFASAAHGKRQRDYAQLRRKRTVYTPAFVVNGEHRWLRDGLPDAPVRDVGRLAVRVEGEVIALRFDAGASGVRPQQAHAALLGMGLSSRIQAGENKGRLSRHEFVVLARQSVRGEGPEWRVPLPRDAREAPRRALVVWLSSEDDPTPLQAAGGFLP